MHHASSDVIGSQGVESQSHHLMHDVYLQFPVYFTTILQDMIDRNITPFYIPGGVIYKDTLLASKDKNLHELGRRLIIPRDWDHYYNLREGVQKK